LLHSLAEVAVTVDARCAGREREAPYELLVDDDD
jgi:hypothetical protein